MNQAFLYSVILINNNFDSAITLLVLEIINELLD